MNIFFLHAVLSICAQYHCDKHVVKMILESAQLLYTTHHIILPVYLDHYHGSIKEDGEVLNPYKKTHDKHPCNLWLQESGCNYHELALLAKELCKEYTHRYKKVHSIEKRIDWLIKHNPFYTDLHTRSGCMTKPKLAMPIEYKSDNVILSYRKYYLNDKQRMFSWKGRPKPLFVRVYELSQLPGIWSVYEQEVPKWIQIHKES